jgi:hypothetical protein
MLSFHQYGRRAEAIGGDHPARAEGLQTHNVSSSEDWRLKQSVSRSLRFFNAHVTEIETTFYERPSSVLYSLSEAAAKAFMSTELRVRGLLEE